jgi:hypothetical protein
MKKVVYHYPHSSFLSMEKDMEIITNTLIKNDNLKKLLHYTSKDCLNKPKLDEDQTYELFGKNIKMVPKLYVDGSVLNYIIVNFDNFVPNSTNPEFRDNIVEFDIICHYDQWQLNDMKLRPYRIAAEIDSMFNGKHLTGIGDLEFVGANQIILTNEYGGLCLLFSAIHGEEDKKGALNPRDDVLIEENFDAIFND